MKRRTILQRLGTAGIATVGFAGTAAAGGKSNVELDRELDVAGVSGRVRLDALLDDRDLERLPADFDPSEKTLLVDADARSIRLQDCCKVCCSQQLDPECLCTCCVCDSEACS